MDAKNLGLGIGILVGLLIVIPVIKAMNKDGKFKTKYDEMQEIARGRAYKYAFWTLVGYEALVFVMESFGMPIIFSSFVSRFLGIIIAVMVQASYSIWNNAYIGLNTNPKRFAIISIFIGVFNVMIGIINLWSNGIIVNGILSEGVLNILVAFCFIVIGTELLIKWKKDCAESEAGEE